MDKILLEELSRIKYLNKYDSNKTSVENNQIISEDGIFGSLFRSGAKEGEAAIRDVAALKNLESERNLLKTLEADKALVSSLSKDMEAVAKELEAFGGIKSIEGSQLKTAEEILAAIKADKIAPAELGRFNVTLFKETSNAKISDALAKDIASSPTFINKYSKRTRSEVVSALEAKGYTKGQANKLFDSMMLKTAEDLKIATDLKSTEELKALEDVKSTEELKTIEDVKAIEDSKAAEDLKKIEDLGKRERELKSESEILQAERELQAAEKELEMLRDKKPNSLMKWFSDLGIVKWGKRIIKAKWFWKIVLIGGGAWLAWYLFFKNKGVKIECPDGSEVDPKTGKCREGSGQEDDNQDNTVVGPPIYDIDDDPTNFVDCVDIYRKGCKDTGDDIERVQECLGVPVTGNFDKKTEDALFDKINKRDFTKSDIGRICRRGSSGLAYRF